MPITLDNRSIDRFAHTPKYRQLADVLRAAIDDGRLQPAEEVPSENAIATAVGISREAVRKSLDVLAGEGLIVRRSGARTSVASPPPRRRMDASRYAEELRLLESDDHPEQSAFTVDHGIEWEQYRVEVEVAKEDATEKDADWLQIKVGEQILRRRFTKFVDGDPVQLQRSAMPWDIAGGTPVADPGRQPWPGGTIAELWELGWRVCKVTEDTTTRNPSDAERRGLEMETPGPVFDIVRVFWARPRTDADAALRAIEVSRVIVPGARNVLHYETEVSI